MPTVNVDGVNIYYEESGQGLPLVFVHEFAGDHRSWHLQMRFFSRRYRAIAFNARGYPPSDVPDDVKSYSQERAAEDIRGVLDGLKIPKAHVCGLSMGGYATLHLGPQLETLDVPTLIMTGGEDDPFLGPAIFMKRKIPTAGLVVLPKSGHTITLGEPEAFNRGVLDFLTAVDAGKWTRRNPAPPTGSAVLPAETRRCPYPSKAIQSWTSPLPAPARPRRARTPTRAPKPPTSREPRRW